MREPQVCLSQVKLRIMWTIKSPPGYGLGKPIGVPRGSSMLLTLRSIYLRTIIERIANLKLSRLSKVCRLYILNIGDWMSYYSEET
jgi:hypothetical protein